MCKSLLHYCKIIIAQLLTVQDILQQDTSKEYVTHFVENIKENLDVENTQKNIFLLIRLVQYFTVLN